MIVEERRSDQP